MHVAYSLVVLMVVAEEASDFLWQAWFMIRHYSNRYMLLSPGLRESPAAINSMNIPLECSCSVSIPHNRC